MGLPLRSDHLTVEFKNKYLLVVPAEIAGSQAHLQHQTQRYIMLYKVYMLILINAKSSYDGDW